MFGYFRVFYVLSVCALIFLYLLFLDDICNVLVMEEIQKETLFDGATSVPAYQGEFHLW